MPSIIPANTRLSVAGNNMILGPYSFGSLGNRRLFVCFDAQINSNSLQPECLNTQEYILPNTQSSSSLKHVHFWNGTRGFHVVYNNDNQKLVDYEFGSSGLVAINTNILNIPDPTQYFPYSDITVDKTEGFVYHKNPTSHFTLTATGQVFQKDPINNTSRRIFSVNELRANTLGYLDPDYARHVILQNAPKMGVMAISSSSLGNGGGFPDLFNVQSQYRVDYQNNGYDNSYGVPLSNYMLDFTDRTTSIMSLRYGPTTVMQLSAVSRNVQYTDILFSLCN